MTKFLYIIGFIICCCSVSAQTISRSAIVSAGGTNDKLSFSVGETVIETVISGTIVLTQGFQQSDNAKDPSVTHIDEKDIINFKVYPNPSTDFVFLELNSEANINFLVSIIDVQGRIIIEERKIQTSTNSLIEFDLSEFKEGNYFIRLTNSKGELLESISIIKL